MLAVPHPAGGAHHLLGGRLPATTADALRRLAKHGTAVNLDPAIINADIPIEWCNMSDERQEVTTRRDDNRPVNGFQGKTVHIWGCGSLGSWLAEFARAGASAIIVCDPGTVTGGLFVRQNYTEADIGQTKADARHTPPRDPRRPDRHRRRRKRPLIQPSLSPRTSSSTPPSVTASLPTLTPSPAKAARPSSPRSPPTPGRDRSVSPTSARPVPPVRRLELDDQAGRSVVVDGGLELYHPSRRTQPKATN